MTITVNAPPPPPNSPPVAQDDIDSTDEATPVVVDVTDGSPADRLGFKRGDIIVFNPVRRAQPPARANPPPEDRQTRTGAALHASPRRHRRDGRREHAGLRGIGRSPMNGRRNAGRSLRPAR